MTSSPDQAATARRADIDDLPPALSSMWRLCKLGYRHEPRLMLAAFVLSQLAALPDALLALWLMLLGEGVLENRPGLVRAAAIGLGVSATATWFLRTVSTRVQRRFRDKVTIALESHVARLQASVATIAHHERPEYLDRLAMLRDQVFVLDHMYMSLFSTCGWILRLGVTVALLASIHPALVLLAVFALPTVLTSTWRPAVERAAQERGAQANRLARHLFTIATTAPPGKEVRVTGIGDRLVAQRREAWERGYAPVAAARWGSAVWHTLAWAVFGVAYVGAVVFVSSGLGSPAGDVLLVLAAGSRLSAYIGATVGEIGFLRGFWMDGSRRLAWLEDYAASLRRVGGSAGARGAAPRHPPRARVVRLPGHVAPGPRRRVAVAAGRLGRRHRRRERRRQDDAGQAAREDVRADVGFDSRRRHAARAHAGRRVARAPGGRVPGLLPLRVPRAPHRRPRRRAAPGRRAGGGRGRRARRRRATSSRVCRRASTRSWVRRGPAASRCRSASGRSSRWRAASCATARCCWCSTSRRPRSTPRPSMRCSSATPPPRAASSGDGRITILVSHRFSTVRMADLIVVLDGARLVEVGTHDELMAKGGQYAELYGIQAAAYR